MLSQTASGNFLFEKLIQRYESAISLKSSNLIQKKKSCVKLIDVCYAERLFALTPVLFFWTFVA
jgi:hypothetical protein